MSRHLGVPEQPQEQTEWCWSATAVSVALFFDHAATWTQCSLADRALGLTTCCANGESDECNKPYQLDNALTITGHFASTSDGKPQFQTIVDEIDAGHPVSISIYWLDGGGHNVTIDGYDDSNPAQPTIDVKDPQPCVGASTCDFNTFPRTYQNGAIWGSSYFTR